MAYIQNMSEEEIIGNLPKMGYPIGQSTRSLLKQKLNRLVPEAQNRAKQAGTSRSSVLSAISSGEEASDSEISSSTYSRKKIRACTRRDDSSSINGCSSSNTSDTETTVRTDGFEGDFESTDSESTECHSPLSKENDIHIRMKPYLTSHPTTSEINDFNLPFGNGIKWSAELNILVTPFDFVFNFFKRHLFVRTANPMDKKGVIPRASSRYFTEEDTHFPTTAIRNKFYGKFQAVSKILLILMLMFFAGLAVYFISNSDSNPGVISETSPICKGSKMLQTGEVKCMPRNEVNQVKNLKKAKNVASDDIMWDTCYNPLNRDIPQNNILTYDVAEYMESKYPTCPANFLKDTCHLNADNSQGKAFGIKGEEVDPADGSYKWAIFSKIMYGLLYTICGLFLLLLMCRAFAICLEYFLHHDKNVYILVTCIFEYVSSQYKIHLASGSPRPFMISVDFVRDQLIPEAERKYSNFLWKSAVNYINKTESCLKQYIVEIDGEKQLIWTLRPYKPSSSENSVCNHGRSAHPEWISFAGDVPEQQSDLSSSVSD